MFGAISSFFGGLASSALGSWLNNEFAKDARADNFDRSQALASWQAKELPAMQVEGLRNAGINPIVAYGNIGSASVPLVHSDPVKVDVSNLGRALTELPERSSALKTAEAQRELLRAQTEESKGRTAANALHSLLELDTVRSAVALRQAQEAFTKSQTGLKSSGEFELKGGLPFGLFSFGFRRPLLGLTPDRSNSSNVPVVKALREARSTSASGLRDDLLDDLWMPPDFRVPVPVKKSKSPGGQAKPYKRPGSLGH